MNLKLDTVASRRQAVFADNVVASSQPLATQAGIEALRKGGNAIDAALATAICLTVVEPTSNGLGSDLFAIVWDGTRFHGLNASGPAPASWRSDLFGESIPQRGWHTITVPGAVGGWSELHKRFGRLSFSTLFERAIAYAREGFLVSPVTRKAWDRVPPAMRAGGWLDPFFPSGRAPAVGDRFRFREQAESLEEIARSNGAEFYEGRLAQAVCAASRTAGPGIALSDLAGFRAEWVEPLTISAFGYELVELPPNCQGITAMVAAGVADRARLADHDVDSPEWIHIGVESIKQAFRATHDVIADPRFSQLPIGSVLEPGFLSSQAKKIRMDQATDDSYTVSPDTGTVYLSAGDADGLMVSLIQSNYMGFGSGIVVPGTGISLQNRGYGFNLNPEHPNFVAPGKRPFHTIIPGFVAQNGKPTMSFGVMGGPMQPQGHLQILSRIFGGGQNPQDAIDAPRWRVLEEGQVMIETSDQSMTEALQGIGHKVKVAPAHAFGGAQLVLRLAEGYLAASDRRKDGHAAGF